MSAPPPPETARHFYRPEDGHGLAHSPFTSIVAPRPIGWISTRGADGVLNLAPYSFFNAFNYMPPLVGFSSVGRKDSAKNAEDTGEFCWNLVSEDLAEAMNLTSAEVGPEVDEFALAGLQPADSTVVSVPYVAQSPVVFECRTSQVVALTDAAGGPTPALMVLGEVVGVHIAQELLVDGVFSTELARPLSRGGGPTAYLHAAPGEPPGPAPASGVGGAEARESAGRSLVTVVCAIPC
ncbi:MAG: flavin reductase family protein [Micrococcus sp.]|nr:flavin reductase family protein [Micrococcus sp.]